ncbi:MAG: hypothetical protein ACYC33_02425 [Thermoleophilia bacterium]
MRIKRIILPAAGVLVIATAAYLVAQGGYESRASTTTTTTVAAVASPYDLTEAPADVDLTTLPDARFASILLETPDGITSYMVAAGQDPFVALAEAVGAAEEVDGPAPSTSSTLTFVLADRVTVTFVMDTLTGLVAREGKVWRPEGDLAALVRAITEQAAAQ